GRGKEGGALVLDRVPRQVETDEVRQVWRGEEPLQFPPVERPAAEVDLGERRQVRAGSQSLGGRTGEAQTEPNEPGPPLHQAWQARPVLQEPRLFREHPSGPAHEGTL